MRRVSRTLCLAAAICLGIATTALAVTPPAGTPDLSQMTIQASDLAPGAQTVTDRYITPASGVVASYSREWLPGSTDGGVPLAVAGGEVQFLGSAGVATTQFAAAQKALAKKSERRLLAAAIALEGRGRGVTSKDVSVGRPRSVSIGDAALELPLTLRFKGRRARVELYFLRVASVIAIITTEDARSANAKRGGHELAADVASHIGAVLAAGGATGATGPTGATG